MKTRLLAALTVLNLVLGTVALTTPASAQAFQHSEANGENR